MSTLYCMAKHAAERDGGYVMFEENKRATNIVRNSSKSTVEILETLKVEQIEELHANKLKGSSMPPGKKTKRLRIVMRRRRMGLV